MQQRAVFFLFLVLWGQYGPAAAPSMLQHACYYSCLAAIGAAGVFGMQAMLWALGFTAAGVAAGSWAAWFQSTFFGGVIGGIPGWIFSALQSMGAAGASAGATVGVGAVGGGTAGITGLCSWLCYEVAGNA